MMLSPGQRVALLELDLAAVEMIDRADVAAIGTHHVHVVSDEVLIGREPRRGQGAPVFDIDLGAANRVANGLDPIGGVLAKPDLLNDAGRFRHDGLFVDLFHFDDPLLERVEAERAQFDRAVDGMAVDRQGFAVERDVFRHGLLDHAGVNADLAAAHRTLADVETLFDDLDQVVGAATDRRCHGSRGESRRPCLGDRLDRRRNEAGFDHGGRQRRIATVVVGRCRGRHGTSRRHPRCRGAEAHDARKTRRRRAVLHQRCLGRPTFAAPLRLAFVEVDRTMLFENGDRPVHIGIRGANRHHRAAATKSLRIGRMVLGSTEQIFERCPEAFTLLVDTVVSAGCVSRRQECDVCRGDTRLLQHDNSLVGVRLMIEESCNGVRSHDKPRCPV